MRLKSLILAGCLSVLVACQGNTLAPENPTVNTADATIVNVVSKDWWQVYFEERAKYVFGNIKLDYSSSTNSLIMELNTQAGVKTYWFFGDSFAYVTKWNRSEADIQQGDNWFVSNFLNL